MSKIQSIIFDKDEFTVAQAKAWLKKNKFRYGKVDSKESTHRFRQFDPTASKKHRTMTFCKGVKAIVEF